MNPFFKTIYYRLPVIALCTVIFWQSSHPTVISEPLFPHDDKVIHLIIYALLAFLFARALSVEKISPRNVTITAILFTTAFGLSDEIHQLFTPERCASALDLLADFAGALLGTLVYQQFFFKNS